MGANEIIQFLAEKGARLDAKDKYGQTALSIAEGDGRFGDGLDKRYRTPRARKTTADLLRNLGATPSPVEEKPGSEAASANPVR